MTTQEKLEAYPGLEIVLTNADYNMDRPRIYVDFNEMLEADLVLLSKEDTKRDSAWQIVILDEGE